MEQHGERRSVLLVEDEVLVRLSVADEFRRAGLTVLEAANADEARAILETHPDWVGVVVTDIQMPGSMDGLGLARLVQERYPATRVVVLSGASANFLHGVKADAVFSKPHVSSLLVRQIKQFLQGQTRNGARNNNAGHS